MTIPPVLGSLITIAILVLWILRIVQSLLAGLRHVKRLHQIPCDRCAFSTGEWHLKCTVHPVNAFSERAIGCRDYEALP